MNETSYIKVACIKVIELARESIKWHEGRLLEEINANYQKFAPPKKWFNKDKYNYDKAEKLTTFIKFDELYKTHPSIYRWIDKYCRTYFFGEQIVSMDYFYKEFRTMGYIKILKMAQFSLDNGEQVMFLGEKDAKTLGIC